MAVLLPIRAVEYSLYLADTLKERGIPTRNLHDRQRAAMYSTYAWSTYSRLYRPDKAGILISEKILITVVNVKSSTDFPPLK